MLMQSFEKSVLQELSFLALMYSGSKHSILNQSQQPALNTVRDILPHISYF